MAAAETPAIKPDGHNSWSDSERSHDCGEVAGFLQLHEPIEVERVEVPPIEGTGTKLEHKEQRNCN